MKALVTGGAGFIGHHIVHAVLERTDWHITLIDRLDTSGNLSEGSGQNLFVVRDGVIYTPPIANSVLWGITRDSVLTIAQDLGFATNVVVHDNILSPVC